jgi:hypothetical protein
MKFISNNKRKTKRPSTTLSTKLQVIHRYKRFLDFVAHKPSKHIGIFDYDDENIRSDKSVKQFLMEENKNHWPNNNQLSLANMFKWIRAYNRGEYFGWYGLNNLNNFNAKSKDILRFLNEQMLVKFPSLSFYHKIVKSPSSPDRYGIIARTNIIAGTFLGFFIGVQRTSCRDGPPHGPHMFATTENNNSVYIDCEKNFTACYARYYNTSTSIEDQNVSIVRLLNFTESNTAVCFISNENISVGHELIIAHDQGYVRGLNAKKRYKSAASMYAEKAAELAHTYICSLNEA